MPRLQTHPSFSQLDHSGCIVCAPVLRARVRQHQDNLRKLLRIAARLGDDPAPVQQGVSETKQEPTRIAVQVGSTAPQSGRSDGRAASAQCDTDSR